MNPLDIPILTATLARPVLSPLYQQPAQQQALPQYYNQPPRQVAQFFTLPAESSPGQNSPNFTNNSNFANFSNNSSNNSATTPDKPHLTESLLELLRTKYQLKLLALFSSSFSMSAVTKYRPEGCKHERVRAQENQWVLTLAIPQELDTDPSLAPTASKFVTNIHSNGVMSSSQCLKNTFQSGIVEDVTCDQCGVKKAKTHFDSFLLTTRMPYLFAMYLPRFKLIPTSTGFVYRKDTRYISFDPMLSKQSHLRRFLLSSVDMSKLGLTKPSITNEAVYAHFTALATQAEILNAARRGSETSNGTNNNGPHNNNTRFSRPALSRPLLPPDATSTQGLTVDNKKMTCESVPTTSETGSYRLSGIVVHKGTPRSGHYIAYRTNQSILQCQTFIALTNLFRVQLEQEMALVGAGFGEVVDAVMGRGLWKSYIHTSNSSQLPTMSTVNSSSSHSDDKNDSPGSTSSRIGTAGATVLTQQKKQQQPPQPTPSPPFPFTHPHTDYILSNINITSSMNAIAPSKYPSYATTIVMPTVKESEVYWFHCNDQYVTPIQPIIVGGSLYAQDNAQGNGGGPGGVFVTGSDGVGGGIGAGGSGWEDFDNADSAAFGDLTTFATPVTFPADSAIVTANGTLPYPAPGTAMALNNAQRLLLI